LSVHVGPIVYCFGTLCGQGLEGALALTQLGRPLRIAQYLSVPSAEREVAV